MRCYLYSEAQETMSTNDERLSQIENKVEQLLQRQRLSRFDSLMFLAYPLVILGITVFANAFLRYGTMQGATIMGVSLSDVLLWSASSFAYGFVAGFLIFLYGYATDSCRLRIKGAQVFWAGLQLMVFTLVVLFVSPWISELGRSVTCASVRWLSNLLMFTGGGAGFFWFFLPFHRFTRHIVAWFSSNAPFDPKVQHESKLILEVSRPELALLISKALWSLSFVIYSIIVVLAWGNLSANTISIALFGLAFFIATECILLWRL